MEELKPRPITPLKLRPVTPRPIVETTPADVLITAIVMTARKNQTAETKAVLRALIVRFYREQIALDF
jgi:hypothetical protein